MKTLASKSAQLLACYWITPFLLYSVVSSNENLKQYWIRGEYFSLSRDSLSLLDFLFLVQLYSNQGVSCRNIGQEQLRVI